MSNTVKDYEKLSEQYNKMLAERNNLIDDLSWYKAKVSRLERENEKYRIRAENAMELAECANFGVLRLEDEVIKYKSLLSEISQHIGNKPSSSTYKYFRAKLDGIGIKEGE